MKSTCPAGKPSRTAANTSWQAFQKISYIPEVSQAPLFIQTNSNNSYAGIRAVSDLWGPKLQPTWGPNYSKAISYIL